MKVAPEEEQDLGPIAPQPGPQTILLACTCSEIFFGGALGAGKTFALALAYAAQFLKYGKHARGLVLRQSFPELGELILTFKMVLEPLGFEYFSGSKTFKHPDGAFCRMGFLGCEDDARKYWGLQYSYMAFDELGDVDEPTWNAIHKIRAARLRSAAGVPVQFVGTGNPCGTAHKLCKDRYIDPAPPFTPIYDEESESYRIFIPGHMADNVALVMGDPKYAKRIRSMTGPKWYLDALINGDWSKNPEGNMFHREWFCKFFDLRQQPNFLFTVSSWDTAFKSTDDSAESAETIWGVTESDIYLLNAFADKLEFPELKAKAEMSYNAWSPNFVWVEDKASGPSLVQSLKKDTRMPVKAIKVDGDKQRRAFVVTPFFEAGKIWLPKSAPWVDKYVEQMCAFPAPGLCDLVDSTSQALTQIEKLRERWKKTQNKVVSLRGSIYGV